jgi:hypothetical protein
MFNPFLCTFNAAKTPGLIFGQHSRQQVKNIIQTPLCNSLPIMEKTLTKKVHSLKRARGGRIYFLKEKQLC